MSLIAPPPAPPRIATGDGDGARKFRIRLTQVMATMITLLATAWACTLGPIPAIIALSIAKHVLVAVLVMGLGVDEPREV
jgi:hypothetical protein